MNTLSNFDDIKNELGALEPWDLLSNIVYLNFLLKESDEAMVEIASLADEFYEGDRTSAINNVIRLKTIYENEYFKRNAN